MEASTHICPNPTCRKTFAKPLKVENLSSGAITVYEACPYCLTEIAIRETAPSVKQKPTVFEEQKETVKPQHEIETMSAQQQSPAETLNCKHYFGFLSERSSQDKLPEECIVCPKIVQCMLKGVIG